MSDNHGSAVRAGRQGMGVASALLLALAALALPSTSVAAPSRDIREVQAQVRDLQMRAASATERYGRKAEAACDGLGPIHVIERQQPCT